MSQARIQLPDQARRGELVEIRVLIRHPMETGFRYNNVGKSIPKNVIHTLVCEYQGREVLRTEFSSGIAANPYLSFFLRAGESGEVLVRWQDDNGESGSISGMLEVIA
jgi:sulfur-oxidizing protein SoxZ